MKGKKRYLLLVLVTALTTLVYFGFEAIAFNCNAKKSRLKLNSILASLNPFCKNSLIASQTNFDHESHKNERKAKKKRRSYLENGEVWFNSYPSQSNEFSKQLWKPVDTRNRISHSINNAMDGRDGVGSINRDHIEFASNCRLASCFNFKRCKPGDKLKIHIYPESSKVPVKSISSTYLKIINIIESSIYYEPDASKACLFITRYDYLDRDPLSPDFHKNLPSLLPIDNGRNHIVFNLYSGTWPDYNELDLSGFNPGYAILAKASYSYRHFRPGFDISIPLFSKSHPERGQIHLLSDDGPEYQLNEEVSIENADTDNINVIEKKNLLVFKGKRYMNGIGSETRNTLHHLHNDYDILIYTTCKHGKKWKDLRDERCAKDNQEYEKYDYSALMSNSTFCLVPRGRRLGSFRFLEALSYGCIPVLLSNNWVKPFDDSIDWSETVVEGDERSLLQLPEILRSYDWRKIEKMRSQSMALYESYFSSVEKIVYTTIAILNERIQSHLSFNTFLWNLVNPGFTTFSGIIWFNSEYSFNLRDYPGYSQLFQSSSSSSLLSSPPSSLPFSSSSSQSQGYTTVLFVNKPIVSGSLYRLIKSISKSEYLVKIIIIWALPNSPQPNLSSSSSFGSTLIEIIIPEIKTINAKLYPYKEIETDAVLSLEPDTTITAEELDFAYLVWRSFPHRIVGFTARDHYYEEYHDKWYYSSKWTNFYSIILLDTAFYHKYYNNLFTSYISKNKALTKDVTNSWDDELCIDLILNFLVSHITREAPIKVTQRKRTSNSSSSLYNLINSSSALSTKMESFNNRQKCFALLYNTTFTYIPLIKSQMRFDPVLFKDTVSNFRKKYRKLEQVS